MAKWLCQVDPRLRVPATRLIHGPPQKTVRSDLELCEYGGYRPQAKASQARRAMRRARQRIPTGPRSRSRDDQPPLPFCLCAGVADAVDLEPLRIEQRDDATGIA